MIRLDEDQVRRYLRRVALQMRAERSFLQALQGALGDRVGEDQVSAAFRKYLHCVNVGVGRVEAWDWVGKEFECSVFEDLREVVNGCSNNHPVMTERIEALAKRD